MRIKDRKHKPLVCKLNDHWSFPVLCLYCFIGILAAMFLGMRAFSQHAEPNDFDLALIIGLTSVIAGFYTKIVDESSSGWAIDDYIDSVPDDRKDMARRMFK